jgi:2-polyprenyl-3-methyl-5-hydroxy-6-metoxy-1,4-benzoquinol methylase
LREFIDYEAGSMHSWAAGYGGMLETPTKDVSRRVAAIKSLSEGYPVERILDFGSGTGEMIEALSECFTVEGLEPELHARNKCASGGMRVHASIEDVMATNRRFDLVTLFHVVEHFYSPIAELSRIFELLKPGGFLVIETPNSQDALLTAYENDAFSNFTYWSHHPMLHSGKSLTNLVTLVGFQTVDLKNTQRYGLANHLYWMSLQRPGGHIIWEGKFSDQTEKSYSADLANQGQSDTLWLTARKPI